MPILDENKTPHPIDAHVGSLLRARRILKGLSQKALAEAVGITFQQIQKYERAANRLSISRLHDICCVLGVDVSYFFQGNIPKNTQTKHAFGGMAENDPQAEFNSGENVMAKKETIELVRAYYSISDEKLRKQLLKMAQTMAENN